MDNNYKISVELMAPINPCLECIETFSKDEKITILGLTEKICWRKETYKKQLLDGDNGINPYIRIAYNGEIIGNDECKNILLNDNDEIIFISSIRGG